MLLDIAHGLAAVHAEGFAHLDLKSANVLVRKAGGGLRAVVTDFGLARTLEAPGSFVSRVSMAGTPAYMAPEQLIDKGEGLSSDMYSFGVIIWELATWQSPWAELKGNLIKIQKAVVHNKARLAFPDDLGADWAPLVALAERCFADDRQARPTAEKAAEELTNM